MRLPDTPLRRIAGSLIGWLAFTFFFALLYNSALTVMLENGGFCAAGGPYVIADGHGCSDLVAWSTPVSIFGGLAAVGIAVWLARGFGVPLVAWAWTILFVGLGTAFTLAFLDGFDWGFGVCMVLFYLMGAAPLVIGLWSPPRWLLLVGVTDVEGRPFTEANPPGVRDWIIAWAIALVGAGIGVWLATLVIVASAA